MAKFSKISHKVTENWELYPLLLAVNYEKKYAYVTFGGLARPYDNADNIRGNTFVLCPSRFRIKTISYYQITNDNLLYDYVALQINKEIGKCLEDIDITERNKEDQFRELRNSNDSFKNLLPKKYDGIRETFDTCLANIAKDNFVDLTETKEHIKNLKECFEVIIGDPGKYYLHYEEEKRFCLPSFYNVEIAKKHDKNAYFDITYIFLKKLYKFLDKLPENLQKREAYKLFKLKNELDAVMSYASHSICYPQWKRLYEHLNKLLMPQTFLGKMYKTVCFSDSEEKFKEYIEKLPGIVVLPENDQFIDYDLDYLVKRSDTDFEDEDNWIQVINENDFDQSSVKKYLDSLTNYSAIFKLSTINMSNIIKDCKYFDGANMIPIMSTPHMCIAHWCKFYKCCKYNKDTQKCTEPVKRATADKCKIKIHWQNGDYTFFYNSEALNTLRNLFAVRVLYESDWYDIAKKNRTFVSKAIRIFCETVMLALYRSGYIPAFYLDNGNPFDYLENKKKDEERIISAAINIKFTKNYISKFNKTVQASMESIVRRLDSLLKETNPDMHGAEYFPNKRNMQQTINKMRIISNAVYKLLMRKKKKYQR